MGKTHRWEPANLHYVRIIYRRPEISKIKLIPYGSIPRVMYSHCNLVRWWSIPSDGPHSASEINLYINLEYKFQFFIENMSLCNMTKIIVYFFVKRPLNNYKLCFNMDEITEIWLQLCEFKKKNIKIVWNGFSV
jgi:hypothetical protein